MPPVEEEEQGVFEEDDELDDSEGDDSDMEDDLDDDDDEEEEEEFPDVSPPPPSSQSSLLPKEEPNSPITSLKPNPNHHSATPARTAPQNGSIKAVPISVSDIYTPPQAQIAAAGEESRRVASAASVDDSRRLFQRLWTDEDEITILQGFLEFTTQRGTTHASHQYDTGPFYEQIKKQLQLEFNKNQLIEKLRRLKKKYRNVVNRMVSGKEFSFKSAHEQATFEISRKIWSASIKRGRDSEDDEFAPNPASAIVEFDSGFGVGAAGGDGSLSSERKLLKSSRRRIRMRNSEQEAAAAAAAVAAAAAAAGVAVEVPIAAPPDPPSSAPIPSIIEETVKSCLSPLFKELLQSAMAGSQGGLIPGIGGIGGGGLLGMNPLQLGIGNLQGNLPVDEKWRNQNILELEVYLKRIELMRDQIKSTLEELKSSTPSSGY